MSEIEELKNQIRVLKKKLQVARQQGSEASPAKQPQFPPEIPLSQDETNVLLRDEIDRQTSNMKVAMEQAAQANQTKSEFLERVSHDLLTPMNGLLGITSLVLETELTAEQRRYLEMVDSSANRLLDVVNNILDFSKIEQGKLDFDNQIFNLRKALEVELYPQQISSKKKGVSLHLSFEPRTPLLVQTDETRLLQVVSNLVRNAILFTNKGVVKLGVSADGYGEDGMFFLKFSVSDTGIGIHPEKQQTIMDSFNRGSVLPNSGSDNSMLGLTISGHLVKLVGGEIGLESGGAGKGTTVWFTWPVILTVDQAAGANDKPKPFIKGDDNSLEGIHILVVEDDLTSRVLIETVLSLAGAEVTVVDNGREAVEEFKTGVYKLILMDIQMPEMDGFACTAAIRKFEREKGGHISIIAITALAMQGDRERCIEAGMDGYVPKPVDKQLLVKTIENCLNKSALVIGGKSTANIIQALKQEGWGIRFEKSGVGAVKQAGLSPFSLIVLDGISLHTELEDIIRSLKKVLARRGEPVKIIGVATERQVGLEEVVPIDCTVEKFAAYLQSRFPFNE